MQLFAWLIAQEYFKEMTETDIRKKIYEEQIQWAKEANVDFVVAETINWTGEMKIALKAIKDAGLIAVTNGIAS